MSIPPEDLSRLREHIEEKVEEIDRRLTIAERHVRERDEAAEVTPLSPESSEPVLPDTPDLDDQI